MWPNFWGESEFFWCFKFFLIHIIVVVVHVQLCSPRSFSFKWVIKITICCPFKGFWNLWMMVRYPSLGNEIWFSCDSWKRRIRFNKTSYWRHTIMLLQEQTASLSYNWSLEKNISVYLSNDRLWTTATAMKPCLLSCLQMPLISTKERRKRGAPGPCWIKPYKANMATGQSFASWFWEMNNNNRIDTVKRLWLIEIQNNQPAVGYATNTSHYTHSTPCWTGSHWLWQDSDRSLSI